MVVTEPPEQSGQPIGAVGARLRRLRQAKELTQRALGEPRYTHAYISSIESGRRMPSRAALEFFASKLDVDVDELLTGRPPDLAPRLGLVLAEARTAISAGRNDEADALIDTVVQQARDFELPRLQAKGEELRGLWLERAGRPEDALERYAAAEELLRPFAATARVEAVAGKARCFEMLGDFRYAVYLLENILDALARNDLNDPSALMRIHSSLVYAYFNAGLFAKANEAASEALRLTPRVSDPQRLAQMHMHVARVLLQKKEIDAAEASLVRAEDLYRQLDLRTEMGGAHLARGYTYAREGRVSEAREQLEIAARIFSETKNQLDAARALTELGRLEREAGRSDLAQAHLTEALAKLRDADVLERALAHRELGLSVAPSDQPSAEKQLRQAIELFERAEAIAELTVSYGALGDLLSSMGDERGAQEAYRTGIQALGRSL